MYARTGFVRREYSIETVQVLQGVGSCRNGKIRHEAFQMMVQFKMVVKVGKIS